ncbi:N-terminal domain of NEFA-interacting nuclear protein NIP30-domain-containing protein [Mycena albidolilacea]|uniref:N-terminal domain of NEFA-interacting nuclear protein NIP30-domain-containing protein n=1 Tax=Mycena albidolilacea TaxID=1033008 RepID=A0AAD7AL24_9AGAR|nr:N-terminal domain of NEFA-interacting nuclear protein NIP30-domain-containing protein [Mycena albidolilacea]
MEEAMVPSLSAVGIGSRFVSQDDVDTAKARRDEQWKAAYARIGMEPPQQQEQDFSDGRSLAEKLAANKIAKQEEWEEKTKLANQFRALEEDEIMFLDSLRERQEAEERERREKDGEEVQSFKEAVAARNNAVNNPPPTAPKPVAAAAPSKPLAPARKKGPLKGVVVKKKAKPPAPVKEDTKQKDDEQPDSKRRRISEA